MLFGLVIGSEKIKKIWKFIELNTLSQLIPIIKAFFYNHEIITINPVIMMIKTGKFLE